MITAPHPTHPVSSEPLRRSLVRRRRESSTFWMMVHLFGSLNVAVVLLITIAGSIAFATLMESKFDSKVAAYYIYNAAWFNAWLLGLGLNLLCAALTRWPWQRKHLGFVITHAGIILLLIGAVVGRAFGFEAFVTLDKTGPPESQLFLRDTLLSVLLANGEKGEIPIDTDLHPPTAARPFVVPLADSGQNLVVDRVSTRLLPTDRLVPAADTVSPPGVALHLLNPGLGQDVPITLLAVEGRSRHDFFGFAQIELVPRLDEAHPIALPPPAPAANTPPRDDSPFHESQVVFAHNAQPPIVATSLDALSGYQVHFELGPDHQPAITLVSPLGARRTWPLRDLQRAWAPFAGEGDPLRLRVAAYWPDFSIEQGRPTSLSQVPRNPAVLVQITGPSRLLPPVPVSLPPIAQNLVLRVAPAQAPGRLVYEAVRAGKVEARGSVSPGQDFSPGWSKWRVAVESVLPHAELHPEVREQVGAVPPMLAASLLTGVQAHLQARNGSVSPSVWIPGGTSRDLFAADGSLIRAGFGQKIVSLDFSIALENFEVPRDEGTKVPANFISTLRFEQPGTGRVRHDRAFMNSPAMFPGDWWRSLLGWNYKFSQANWDPQNLNVTTLQVLFDPGWPLKWFGSLLICLGITLMFYFMPKRTARERSGRAEEETAPFPAKPNLATSTR